MTYKETVVHGHVSTEHLVQLFDSADSLADVVSSFLRDGFLAGDSLLVVSVKEHWHAIGARLRASGIPLEKAVASGQLSLRDATDTLRLFMRRGVPDRALFDGSVGTLVRQLKSGGGRLRIYGEMVDLLAAEGEYRSAQRLEDLWNELSEREPFTLFCGYSAANFGDPHTAEALRLICRSHSQVRSHPRDILGAFLLEPHATQGALRPHPGM